MRLNIVHRVVLFLQHLEDLRLHLEAFVDFLVHLENLLMHVIDVDVLIRKLLSLLIDCNEEEVPLVLLLDKPSEDGEVSQVSNDACSLL